ncbi:STM3941 family protein [Flavobacterium ammonificans]|uniref:STM3941 family protein n=1 Tax=Flavobacterium ammonificans TaxID=1751056 RepID=UPI003B849ECC
MIENNIPNLKSTDLSFYSNKIRAFFLLLISSLMVFCGINENLFDFELKPFKSTMLLLGFVIFVFGIIISILYLIRTKPLLTVTKNEIIIYNILSTKKTNVNFEEIKSFFVITTSYKGITNNRQICIQMKKPIKEYNNSLFYKFLLKFDIKIANSQYVIQTNFLNINHKKLLAILNDHLKNDR